MRHPYAGRARTRRTPVLVSLLAIALLAASGCLYHPNDATTPEAVDARLAINDLLDQADAAEEGGDPATAQQLRDDAALLECQTFGCDAPLGTTTIRMDPNHSAFFDAPWPSDTRRHADGTIDLTGFPGRAANPFANVVLARGEAATDGFGTNSAVYLQASGPVDEVSLPLWAEASVGRRSNVMVLNLDDPAAPPHPVLADVSDTASAFRPADLISVLPYPGHPLDPGARYVALLFDGVRDTGGNRLAPSPLIEALDGGAPAGVPATTWAALRQDRDDAVDAVRTRTLWHPSELVAFTAFTTQDPTVEMEAIAGAVAALPAPEVLSRTPFPGSCTPGTTVKTTARLALPSWQQGTRPFLDAGGAVVVGGDGLAVQQGVQLGSDGQGVLLSMAVPCGPAPADGWPILLWMDGTGASANASPIGELGPNLPYAVLAIAPLYSGDRLEVAAAPFDTPEVQYFNYLNPLAARTNQLQQAADMLYLKRLAQNLTLSPGEAGSTVTTFDADTVVMAGHSQGASTLTLTLAFDPTVDGAFLSAAGGGLYHSIVHRADVRALVDGILGTAPGELDIFHPYPQILQTFAEGGDATNYAAMVTNDVVLYAGLRDGCTSIEVATQLAQALGIPVANPQARNPMFGPELPPGAAGYTSPFEPSVAALPVAGNLAGGTRTAVMVEVDSGHFGASAYPSIGRSFVDAIATTGTAVVDPGPTPAVSPGSSCPRFDPPPLP